MMLCAAGACLSHLWKSGPLTLQIASVALIVPAMSTVLYLGTSLGVPDLYALNRLRFPLTVTLPLIYTAMLLLSATLISRVGLSITRMPDTFAAINVWADWWVLAITFAAGAICLSLLGVFEGERQER